MVAFLHGAVELELEQHCDLVELEKWGLEVGFELEVVASAAVLCVGRSWNSSISTIPAEEKLFWKLRPTES